MTISVLTVRIQCSNAAIFKRFGLQCSIIRHPYCTQGLGRLKVTKGISFFIAEMETRKLWRRCKCPEGIWPRSTYRLRTGKKKRRRFTPWAHPVGRPTILSYLFWPAYSQLLDNNNNNNNNRVHPSKHRFKVISKFGSNDFYQVYHIHHDIAYVPGS